MGYSEAAYWLAVLSVQAPLRRIVKRMLSVWCVENQRSAAALFVSSLEEVAQICGLAVDEVRPILAARLSLDRAQRAVEELERLGAHVLTRAEDAYPDEFLRLEEAWQPYSIVYRGDLAILTEPGVAILGTAHPDKETANLARELAQWLVQQGHHLVGGFDEGVDRLALESAAAIGGAATAILAEGLLNARGLVEGEGAGPVQGMRLLLSPFAPDASWRENQAVARRALILALCSAAFFLSPEGGPSQWPLIGELGRGGMSLFLWQRGAGALPADWMEVGARPFRGLEDLQSPAIESEASFLRLAETEGPEAPPITFRDAQEAIARLGQTGKVPEKLARRLRATLPKGPSQ